MFYFQAQFRRPHAHPRLGNTSASGMWARQTLENGKHVYSVTAASGRLTMDVRRVSALESGQVRPRAGSGMWVPLRPSASGPPGALVHLWPPSPAAGPGIRTRVAETRPLGVPAVSDQGPSLGIHFCTGNGTGASNCLCTWTSSLC